MASANMPQSGVRVSATGAGLDVAKRRLQSAQTPLLLGVAGWGFLALGVGFLAICALSADSTGWRRRGSDLELFGLALPGVGALLLLFSFIDLIMVYFGQSTREAVGAIGHPAWRQLARGARRAQIWSLAMPPCVVFWLVRTGQVCRFVAAAASDEKLLRLCAEFRRSAWVLLAQLMGLPLVLAVLADGVLGRRLVAAVAALVMAMSAYVLLVLLRVVSRAAAALDGLGRP